MPEEAFPFQCQLSSPSRAARVARLEELADTPEIPKQVVEALQEIENVPASITVYRDRERHLETLLKLLRSDEYKGEKSIHVYAIHYLVGSLYVNFEKFWGPTVRVIYDIIQQSKSQSLLLHLLLSHFRETNEYIYNETKRQGLSLENDRPDFILHRNFTLQLLARFPAFVESNNTLFMDQFFLFVEKEMLVSPFIEKFERRDLTRATADEDDDNSSEDENPVDRSSESNHTNKQNGRPKKVARKPFVESRRKSRETFITASKIIQSFKNINRVHRGDELRAFLMDLLCCRDSAIQKSAFNCLLVYENDAIKPYTDKLFRILNDEKVRTELTMFSIDASESEQILWEHRGELIPILQRILFGRMIGSVGRKSSGRDKSDVRKALIMRFIAGCTVDEILYFFELLFDPLFENILVPYNQLETVLRKNLNLKAYVPPNKLHAMLVSLEAYIDSVAHLREGSLSYVLKLINIVMFHVVAPLEDPELLKQISPKNVDFLRAIRRSCLNLVKTFFDSFVYYTYSQEEINFIFKITIWPSTQGFVDKNHASITPFLKLVETFAMHDTYHRLLVKRNKSDENDYLLRHIIDLYGDAKTKPPVLKLVASMLANILNPDEIDTRSIDDVEQDEDAAVTMDVDEVKAAPKPPMLMVEDAIEPQFDKSIYKPIQASIPYGHLILLSSIPHILERLQFNCKQFIDKKDSSYRVEKSELSILSTLSEYLVSSDQSLIATKLLLTTLDHQRSGDLILSTLKTVQSLMRQVDGVADASIVDQVADILGYQRNNEQRDELCNFIDILATKDENLRPTNDIIRSMNATNVELVDEPDLAKWNEGFRLSFKYLSDLERILTSEPSVARNSLVLLIHQTGFIINTVDRYEFSIRENCYLFYERLAKNLNLVDGTEKPTRGFLDFLIDKIILDKFLKKGLRDRNESIKHTFIEVLRLFAVHCHEKNAILGEFHMFCHDNQDLDFWRNIKHIQLHNRSKALARLIGNENLEKVSAKTLSSYFMPIACGFLFNKTYSRQNSLVENSIKLIGLVARQLTWHTYEATLSYYLGQLTKANATYQRMNIKLITAIIMNFNFDLTNCQEAMQHEEEDKKLELRMRKRLNTNNQRADKSPAMPTKKLNPSTAKMVYLAITNKLIPRLNSLLHEMTHVEFEHDKNMSNYVPEKDEIKRIPLAFAIVQMLSLLPCRYVLFRDHLPAIFLKLVSFLKSKNKETRVRARRILIAVMTFEPVGPTYMPDLLRVLKQNLDKGFHIHVLNYTIHSVLESLREAKMISYGDLDGSVHELIDSCMHEVFGRVSEDKEVAQIIAKTFEARKTKSYDTLMILASFISAEKLPELMKCITEHLRTSSEMKKINKLSTCLQRIFTGLAANDGYPLDKLLVFIQQTIEESIPSLKVRQKVEMAEQSTNAIGPAREDRFLIAKDRTKERVKSKINEKGNLHMLVENSLRLLQSILDQNKVDIRKKASLQRQLDGFIALLSTCLKSSSPNCVCRALKCIHFIAKTKPDLPTFKTKCNSIVKKIFILLNLYNGVGMVHGDNYDMINMCFKTLTLLLLKCEHVQLEQAQIEALMSYIAQDLSDSDRQNTAFSTLNCLLERKYNSSELPKTMTTVAELLVTSCDDSVRKSAVRSWQIYLLDYKHPNKQLQSHLDGFLNQLEYPHIDGRRSVIKMLRVIVEKFPERILRDHFLNTFLLLSSTIINDDSKEVRHSIGNLTALLLQRLPDQQEFALNKLVLPWVAADREIPMKTMGIKMISVFLEASRDLFGKKKGRMQRLLDIILGSLEMTDKEQTNSSDPKSSDELTNGNSDQMANGVNEDKPEPVRLLSKLERLHYHSLRLFKRLLDNKLISCIEERYLDVLKRIWQIIAEDKLSHWHEPTLLTSCELYLLFIRSTDLQGALKVEHPITDNYLDWNATRIMRKLCDRFIDLTNRFTPSNKVFMYAMEGIHLLGRMVVQSHATLTFEEQYLSSFEDRDPIGYLLNLNQLPNDGIVQGHLPFKVIELRRKANLMWLSLKMFNQARREVAMHRLDQTHQREMFLKWLATISQDLGPKRIAPYIFLFMMTPVRELTDKAKGKSFDQGDETFNRNLVVLSDALLNFFKSLMGVELFNKVYSKVQLHYTRRRVERKKSEALLRVKDQARGVKRKIKKQKSKDVKRRANKAKQWKANRQMVRA